MNEDSSTKSLSEYDPKGNKVLLSDVLDRVLSTGVTITGDLTIGVADVDLIYCGIRVLLSSVDKLRDENLDNID